MKFGWYSPKMAEVAGTIYWYTPYGGRVEVTCVTDGEDHGIQWDDVYCVGAVTNYSHQGRRGERGYGEGGYIRTMLQENADGRLFGATQ